VTPPPELLLAWLLSGVRITALCMAAPVFAHTGVPVRVRVAFAMVTASALAPALPAPPLALGDSAVTIAGAVAGEAAAGLALGFAARLVFDAIGLLGGFVSVQGGLGAASVIDPASGAATTALSALLETVAVLIWLAIEGPAALLRGLRASFDALPLGGGGPDTGSWLALARLGAACFTIAVQLAAPVTVAMLLANLALGFVGRALPEVNLMALQLPAHVLLLLALLWLGATPIGDALADVLSGWTATAVVPGVP
jgi:flagellar biosynthetic protein FliR